MKYTARKNPPNNKAITYDFFGTKVYIYWRVCDELGIPKTNGFRRYFHRHFEIGEFAKDKFKTKDQETIRGILKDHYYHAPSGLMFITEGMKEQLQAAWNVYTKLNHQEVTA